MPPSPYIPLPKCILLTMFLFIHGSVGRENRSLERGGGEGGGEESAEGIYLYM